MATAVPSAIPGYEAYLLEEARRRRMLPQAMQQLTAPVTPPVTYDYSDLNSILPSAMSRQMNPDFAAPDTTAAAPEMPVMPAVAPVEAPQTRALPQAVEAAQSTLTQNVQPGDAVGGYRQKAADFSRQATEAMSQEPDMTAAQNYMRQRTQQGDMAMLNALAAQFAGERFEPIQAKYLRRAAAAREPMKVGRGMVTPDGQFIRDEGAVQDQRVQLLLQQAKAYEQMALTAETEQDRAEARAAQLQIQNRLAEMGLSLRQQALETQRMLAQNKVNQPPDNTKIIRIEDNLRNEFLKRADKIRDGTGHAQNVITLLSDPTIRNDATKQVSLVFSFGKMLDPESVVRESEYSLIAGARGLFDSLQQMLPALETGAKLTPSQLQSMRQIAQQLMTGSSTRLDALAEDYYKLAKRRGADPENVLPSYATRRSTPAGGGDLSAAARAELERRQKEGKP